MIVLFSDNPDTDKLLKVAKDDRELPAETALLGSAMGFYHGSQSKSSGG